jgi:hypothetical protein
LFAVPVSETIACRPTEASQDERDFTTATLERSREVNEKVSVGKRMGEMMDREDGSLVSRTGVLSTGTVRVEVLVYVKGKEVGGVLDGHESGARGALERKGARRSAP